MCGGIFVDFPAYRMIISGRCITHGSMDHAFTFVGIAELLHYGFSFEQEPEVLYFLLCVGYLLAFPHSLIHFFDKLCYRLRIMHMRKSGKEIFEILHGCQRFGTSQVSSHLDLNREGSSEFPVEKGCGLS